MVRSFRLVMVLGLGAGLAHLFPVLASDPEITQLRQQLQALQTRVEILEAQMKTIAAGATIKTTSPSPAPPSATYEKEAQELVNEIIRLTDQGEADKARAKVAELRMKYPNSKVAGQGTYFSHELEVIGKEAPSDWGIEKWFQGQGQVDLSSKQTTVVVFWEEWCPHCKDQMPKIQQLFTDHRQKGLQVLGITKVTQTATDEKVRAYLEQNQIQFPVGKEAGAPSSYFNVKGIPAAAILKGGKVVWRGHPIRLSNELVLRWLDKD